ncbi:MAG TPA: phosphatase PAP2 family protein [Actinomycetes bacterium]
MTIEHADQRVAPPQDDRGGGSARRRAWVASIPWERSRRPNVVFELVLILTGYWLYSLVRNGVPVKVAEATTRAQQLYDFERMIGIAVEKPINHAVDKVSWLAVGANYYYSTMHFIVTIAVLVWMWFSYPGRYRPLRRVLYATNMVALLGFWLLPLAPPRFLSGEGFIDTVVKHGTWGTWASADVASYSNQYAAMPSMHCAWSLWCGLIIATLAKRHWVKALGIAYPVATGFVVVATGNHFVLDIVGGYVALGLAFAIQALIFKRPALRTPHWAEAGSGADAERVESSVTA